MKFKLLVILCLISIDGLAEVFLLNQSVSAYSQDKVKVFVDVSVSYKLNKTSVYDENLDEFLSNKIKSSVVLFCGEILGAESFLLPRAKEQLLLSLQTDLEINTRDVGIEIKTLSIDNMTLSKYVMQAIAAREVQEKAVAKKMAIMKQMRLQAQKNYQNKQE